MSDQLEHGPWCLPLKHGPWCARRDAAQVLPGVESELRAANEQVKRLSRRVAELERENKSRAERDRQTRRLSALEDEKKQLAAGVTRLERALRDREQRVSELEAERRELAATRALFLGAGPHETGPRSSGPGLR